MTVKNFKVLFPFVGDSIGGSHLSSLELACELQSLGVEPVIGLHQSATADWPVSKAGLPCIELPAIQFPCILCPESLRHRQMMRNAQQLSQIIRFYKFGFVHTNDQRMHLTWQIPSNLEGAQHIWHQRSPLLGRRSGKIARSIGLQSKHSQAVLTVSEFCKASFPRSVQRQVKVIYDPIKPAPKSIRPSAIGSPLATGSPDCARQLRVVWVANWTDQKRPFDFLNFAALANRTGISAQYSMVGRATARHLRKAQALIHKLGLKANLEILGHRADAVDIIAHSDVLVATAVNEGLGRTLVEAMQLQTLVLAANSGGHREVIVDNVNGRLFEAGNATDAVSVLRETLTAPHNDRVSMLTVAQDVSMKFAPDRHARAIVGVYRNVN